MAWGVRSTGSELSIFKLYGECVHLDAGLVNMLVFLQTETGSDVATEFLQPGEKLFRL